MQQGDVVELDTAMALSAAKVGFDLKLPLADSVILATVLAHGAIIWTQDSDFEGINGVEYISRK